MADLATEGMPSLRMGDLRAGRGPQPAPRDYWIFFVALPLCFSLWAAAVGIGPTRTMSFGNAFLYASTHFAAAWWGNGAACLAVAILLRRYRPPLSVVLLAGHAFAWLPLYLFYLRHSAYFGSHFEALTPDPHRPELGLSLAYTLHTLRYSTVPFLMIWFGAVYGYLFWTGVRFFSSLAPIPAPIPPPNPNASNEEGAADRAAGRPGAESAPAIRLPTVRPAFLRGSRLAPDAEIYAVKAEEHYVRIWSATGTDLVRYRLTDAIDELSSWNGSQIHRSWWINWEEVREWQHRGRSIEIVLSNGLRVPVSLAHKADALRRLAAVEAPAQPATAGTAIAAAGNERLTVR